MQYRIININDISDGQFDYYYSLMSEEKRQKIARFRFEEDKKRSIAGELLAREMIASYCKVKEEDIIFNQNDYSKPYAENLDVQFNISHSNDLVVCALCDKPIGADIEKTHDIDGKIISFACCEAEKAYINDTPDKAEKLKRFFKIWTFKEAFSKWQGTGITDLKGISYFDDGINEFCKTIEYGEYIISFYHRGG